MAATAPVQGQDDELVSRVHLFVSCKGLKNMDTFSKSDPQMIVLGQSGGSTVWNELGRTEMVKDNLNPRFDTPIEMDYRFEEMQKLKFVCVDVDDAGRQWQDQDQIGALETHLGKIVGSRNSTLTAPLESQKHKKPGDISISVEEVAGARRCRYELRFSARKLDKKDFLGKSDPFLVISKQGKQPGSWLKVHQTEVIKSNLNPSWKPLKVTDAQLTGGQGERPLRFEVFDWDKHR
jgi:Ca2+-dependent lipid-binding protein